MTPSHKSPRPQRAALRAAVAGGCIAGLVAGIAPAQEQAGENSHGLETVTVTAQRREENLQQVPVAVTALSAEALENYGVTNTTDLSGLAPNFRVQTGRGGGAPFTAVRGMFGISTGPNRDNSLAFYIDGINLARMWGQQFDVADLERVEILLGPQGTLFGRNATAGAVNFITRSPSGKFELKQDVGVYNDEGRRIKTRVDLPEWNGLSVAVSYLHDEQDGFVDNPKPPGYVGPWPVTWDFTQAGFGIFGKYKAPEKTGGHDTDAALLALKYEPTGIEGLRFDVRVDYSDSNNITPAEQALSFVADSPAAVALFSPVVAAQPAVGGFNTVSLERLDDIATSVSFMKNIETLGASLTTTYEANDNLTLKNIFGYRDLETCCGGNESQGLGGLVDPAGTGRIYRVDGLSVSRIQTDSYQDDVQVLVTSQKFDLTAGAYFFDEKTVTESVGTPGGRAVPTFVVPAGSTTLGVTNSNNTSFSIYSQGTWHATEKLDLTVGLRQNWDHRTQDIVSLTADILAGLAPRPPVGSKSVDFEKLTYTGIIQYNWTQDLMTYLKRSSGYVSGGVIATSGQIFQPENLYADEIGMKWQFWDSRARLNLTAFRYDYEDFQFPIIRNSILVLDNVQQVDIWGFETEFSVTPMDGLVLGVNTGYRNLEFKKYLTPEGIDVTAQQRPNYSPKWQAGFNINYDLPSGRYGAPFFQIDGFYQTEINHLASWAFVPNKAVDEAQIADPSFYLNARVGFAEIPLGSTKMRMSLWGKNLLDYREPWAGGSNGVMISLSYHDPISYGIDFTVSMQ